MRPSSSILKTELEAAIQRYVDLFDFAPIGYVSFDRVGHIEEINVAAARLLGGSRDRLIGRPFALYIIKEDSALFLNHLLRCRSSESRVETELHLKKRNGEIILAHLASSRMTSSMRDGAAALSNRDYRSYRAEAGRRSDPPVGEALSHPVRSGAGRRLYLRCRRPDSMIQPARRGAVGTRTEKE